jgi:hypothetical protein
MAKRGGMYNANKRKKELKRKKKQEEKRERRQHNTKVSPQDAEVMEATAVDPESSVDTSGETGE